MAKKADHNDPYMNGFCWPSRQI